MPQHGPIACLSYDDVMLLLKIAFLIFLGIGLQFVPWDREPPDDEDS